MAQVNKINSNVTGLRYAEEASIGVLPGSPVWNPLEPNSYTDFGGSVALVSRNPINPSRQRKKGVITDLDASGGFNSDMTQSNLQDILQGFFFADLRRKSELDVATVDGVNDDFEPASGGDSYVANDLLFAKGFSNSANNGLHVVSGVPAATSVPVTSTLEDETGATGVISKVGFEFGSGEVEIDVSGTWPVLNRASGTKDFTDFGLLPGEWIFIGGDATAEQFATAANNGFARVRRVTATTIEFDKTAGTMVADTGATKTIRIFFGRLLKNETGSSIVRRSYNLERTLGAPDDSAPNDLQAEYLTGAVANELTLQVNTADKLMADLGFVAINSEVRTSAQGLKSGSRPAIVEADAFNTSSDIKRIKLSTYTAGSANPTPLFAFVTDMTLVINNNVTPNKAVSVLGAFDVTAGTFEIGGSINAYFASVEAVSAVRNNDDITLDMHIVKNNSGISIDVPLISLGDGRPNVEQDQAIMIPLETQAATGAGIDPEMDHTLQFVFYDYLPDLAS